VQPQGKAVVKWICVGTVTHPKRDAVGLPSLASSSQALLHVSVCLGGLVIDLHHGPTHFHPFLYYRTRLGECIYATILHGEASFPNQFHNEVRLPSGGMSGRGDSHHIGATCSLDLH
jgi:hypothetical protein